MMIETKKWIPLVVFLIAILAVGIAVIVMKSKYAGVKTEKHMSEPIAGTPEQKITRVSRNLNETMRSIYDYLNLFGISTTFIVLSAGLFIWFIIIEFASRSKF